MANLQISDRKINLAVILRGHYGDGREELQDYLKDFLPDARCSFVIGSCGPNGSYDEYSVTVDVDREPALLLTLRDFCNKNDLTHQLDIAD